MRVGSSVRKVGPVVTDLPPMPDVPAKGWRNGLSALTDGHGLTIGWQFRAEADGGRVFVIIRRSRLGWLAVVESFPLTAEGWAAAWQALAARYPRGVEPTLAALRLRACQAPEDGKAALEDRQVPEGETRGIGTLVVSFVLFVVLSLAMVWGGAALVAEASGLGSYVNAVALLVFGLVSMAFGILAIWAIVRDANG